MIARALSALGFRGKPDLRPDVPMQARPAETLEQHIMDVNIAKSDAEWWARREIEILRERFKLAAIDLAKQAEEIAGLRGDVAAAEKYADECTGKIVGLERAIASLKPDALAMRRKRQRDRDRKDSKKGVSRG